MPDELGWHNIKKGELPPDDGSLVWAVWEEDYQETPEREPRRFVELAKSFGTDIWEGVSGIANLDTENGRVTHWQYAILPPLPKWEREKP